MRLKLALVLDDRSNVAWIARIVDQVRQMEDVEIGLAIHRGCGPEDHRGLLGRLWAERHHALYHLYSFFDRRLHSVAHDPFMPADLNSRLEGVAEQLIVPLKAPLEAIYKAVEKTKPDLVIDLSAEPIAGPILGLAPLGVWSLYFGGASLGGEAPPGFWELARRKLVIGVSLKARNNETGAAHVLCAGYSSVESHSTRVTISKLYWRATLFVPRLLRQIQRGQSLKLPPEPFPPEIFLHPQRRPFNRRALWPLLQLFWQPIRYNLWRAFWRSQWRLFFHTGALSSAPLAQFRELVPPADRFWADPHLIYKDGMHYIFLEECLFKTGRSYIACLTIDGRGNCSEVRPVLQRSYNMSYPSLFEWQGELYMLPETSANRTLEVYRSVRLPDQWALHKVLLSGIRAVDTHLFAHGGRWWLFTNLIEHPGTSAHDELFLFSADSPLSDDWTPHPMNPIVSDVRRARNAGAIFTSAGKIYRPGQACAPYYGSGLRLHEIEILNGEEYREREVQFIEPNWSPGLTGVHTLATDGRLTVMDACRWTGRRPNFLGPVRRADDQAAES